MANEFVARNGIIALKDSVVSGSLTVTGDIIGTIPTASHALTASSADNLTVRGTITAETLVVQTITSSVSWITGSTEFGSIISNTHEFTGSVSISGSLSVNNNSVIVSNQTSSMTVLSASYALTASYALNAGGASASGDKITSGSITASVDVTGASFKITSGSSTFAYLSSSGNLGLGTTFPTTKLHISSSTTAAYFRGSGSGVFAIDGNSGRLFSVDDSLSGSLFSVNTIAGLPVIEAFSDNTVRIGQYGQRGLFVSQSSVGIGTETPQFKLDVTGSVRFVSNPIVSGSFTVVTLTGSFVEFQATSTGIKIGSAITDFHTVTGSLNVSGSITGSLFGTASWAANATSASYSLNSTSASVVESASYALSASFVRTSATASHALTASSADTFLVRNNLAINSGSTTGTPKLAVHGVAGSSTAGSAPNIEIRASRFGSLDYTRWLLQVDNFEQFGTWYYNNVSYSKVGYQTTGGTWTNSDERRKENIQLINYGLKEVLQLFPKKFNYKIDEYKKIYLGFIAQDVLPIIPEAVQSDIDDNEQYYAMNYDNLVPVLVNAIKEQQLQIDQLKAEIEILKNK
jgi:hypothetical protein